MMEELAALIVRIRVEKPLSSTNNRPLPNQTREDYNLTIAGPKTLFYATIAKRDHLLRLETASTPPVTLESLQTSKIEFYLSWLGKSQTYSTDCMTAIVADFPSSKLEAVLLLLDKYLSQDNMLRAVLQQKPSSVIIASRGDGASIQFLAEDDVRKRSKMRNLARTKPHSRLYFILTDKYTCLDQIGSKDVAQIWYT